MINKIIVIISILILTGCTSVSYGPREYSENITAKRYQCEPARFNKKKISDDESVVTLDFSYNLLHRGKEFRQTVNYTGSKYKISYLFSFGLPGFVLGGEVGAVTGATIGFLLGAFLDEDEKDARTITGYELVDPTSMVKTNQNAKVILYVKGVSTKTGRILIDKMIKKTGSRAVVKLKNDALYTIRAEYRAQDNELSSPIQCRWKGSFGLP